MLGEVEWENVHLAGAFVLGAVLGAFATLRVMRAVLRTFEQPALRRRRPTETPERGVSTDHPSEE